MLALFETAAGYALFRVLGDVRSEDLDEIPIRLEDPERCHEVLKIKSFLKFDDMEDAVTDALSVSEGKLPKKLKKFLIKEFKEQKKEHDSLIVSDLKLGSKIAKKLGINVVSDAVTMEIMRGIRAQFANLVGQLEESALKTVSVGLSHSISRSKLKFSPDKVDVMVIKAVSLLDDLDKEFNIYTMRLKEWYGWHFPELSKVVTDNMAYVRVVDFLGDRINAANLDFSNILPKEVEDELKMAAKLSMGTEISNDDVENIKILATQIISMSEYRAKLSDYLHDRMVAIAPNLTKLVGEIVGARLISHAGSLMNLAKHPASTIQILGSERALFKALKSKHDTPKYGLIFHASLVGQAAPKSKGKIARSLAAKAALSVRYDAFGETLNLEIGENGYNKVLSLLNEIEKNKAHKTTSEKIGHKTQAAYKFKTSKRYNPSNDIILD